MSSEAVALRTRLARFADLGREVPAFRVSPMARQLAELTARKAAERLGIPTPRVRWLPDTSHGYLGCCYPECVSEIWVVVRKDLAAIVETVAHETRHAWQLSDYHWLGFGLDSDELREEDAAIYGRDFRRRMTGGA